MRGLPSVHRLSVGHTHSLVTRQNTRELSPMQSPRWPRPASAHRVSSLSSSLSQINQLMRTGVAE